MKKYIKVLEQTSLFNCMAQEDIEKLLGCLHARQAEYEKGEMVIWEDSTVTDIGLVLSGHARSIMTDASGKSLIVSLLETGSFIGVLLAASRERKSPVSVQAQDHLCVLFIPAERVMSRCVNACPQHDLLLRNFLDSIAEKSLELHDRIDCLIRHTVREKILAYLTKMDKNKEGCVFTIPLDRKAMAEYVNVERSALSRELSRMNRDGLIDYYKNSFKLLKKF